MSATKRWFLIVLAASALAAVAYLIAADSLYRLGFPLDDAWIHQVYARNLAQHGEWAFAPGQPSAGSTSPLWAALLALGYLAGLPHLLWAYLVGTLVLAATGWLAAQWLAARLPAKAQLAWVAALLLPLEWHLVWAALSGMETLAFGALALLCCSLSERRRDSGLLVGLLIGIGIWLRPESLLLLVVPTGWVLLERRDPLRQLARTFAGSAPPIAAYLVFQRALSGQWWPNTFFAKQAEYASLRAIPLSIRFLTQLGVPGEWLGRPELAPGGPLVGLLLALLPGLAITVAERVRRRRWASLLPLGWCVLHLMSYAVRLPGTYQHGRYALPTIPILLVMSVEGLLSWLDLGERGRGRWVLSRAWPATLLVTGLAFLGLGASSYGREVAFIESEMVETARWLDQNTLTEAVIAAHDIGALGYFTQRPMLDLAGLVSPEVIPIIRDQDALAQYLDRHQARYLVAFPDWYPELIAGRPAVHTTGAIFGPSAGGENMTVYLWE